MATSKEIRIENLRALVKEFKTADAVAQRAATAPMYLSQILSSAKSSTGTARGVGDKLARKLEDGCGRPEGWMDVDHSEQSGAGSPQPAPASLTHVQRVNEVEAKLLDAYRTASETEKRRILAGLGLEERIHARAMVMVEVESINHRGSPEIYTETTGRTAKISRIDALIALDALTEREARMLSLFRMSIETSKATIEAIASEVEKEPLSAVINNKV